MPISEYRIASAALAPVTSDSDGVHTFYDIVVNGAPGERVTIAALVPASEGGTSSVQWQNIIVNGTGQGVARYGPAYHGE